MAIEKMSGLLNVQAFDKSFIWQTLKRAGYNQNEDDLLRAIIENKSKKVVHYAVMGLWDYGTAISLPALKKLTHYPSQDVRTTAVVTIGVIAKGKESEFYGELLDDPGYRDKAYPMTVLWEVGTEVALPAVIRLGQKIIDKTISLDTTDPRYVEQFLEKYKTPETQRLIEQLELLVVNMQFGH